MASSGSNSTVPAESLTGSRFSIQSRSEVGSAARILFMDLSGLSSYLFGLISPPQYVHREFLQSRFQNCPTKPVLRRSPSALVFPNARGAFIKCAALVRQLVKKA